MTAKRKVLIVVGTRPNFIKVTQFKKVAENYSSLEIRIVHTGQHYDAKMADVFFEQFGLVPDFFLNVTTGSPVSVMANIMTGLETLINEKFRPQLVIVVGDVNSTLAASIVANKLNIPIAHLESGLRSNDRTMPEEHNRVLTDAVTDHFFVTEQSGYDNLIKEGKDRSQLYFVGNTMIDTMVAFREHIDSSDIESKLNIENSRYVLMTMHRPATVDSKENLSLLLKMMSKFSQQYRIVFPVHPRTLKNIKEFGLMDEFNDTNVIFLDPLDYFSFQKLISGSKFILTDSGGIQEESTFLGVPCLTLRPNTERPVTCTVGTNTLVPFDADKVSAYVDEIEQGKYKKGEIPPMWDGKATERIVQHLDKILS